MVVTRIWQQMASFVHQQFIISGLSGTVQAVVNYRGQLKATRKAE